MRKTPLRFTVGYAVLCSALSTGASLASTDVTYIEALGQSLLVNAPQLEVQSGGTPLPSPQNSNEETTSNPFSQTPVSPASNVDRANNIPSFSDTAPREVSVPAAPITQAQPIAAPVPAVGAGNQLNVNQPLPSPKLNYANEVMNQVAPMDTETVRTIMNEIYLRQGAAATPIRPGLTCESSQYALDLSPGATPPIVRVTKGVGAIVNFVDSAGNPWPITFARNFHEQASSATQMAPHVLSVTANSPHLQGSIGVVLQDLTTPITFIVTPGQEQTDCRVDLRVAGLAPGATPVAGKINSRPGMASGGLMDYIYGSTPDGAKRLKIQMTGNASNTTRAWQSANGKLILRTPASVVSPGWYQSVSALDGTTVYEMPPTSVINVSVDGQPIKVIVRGLTPQASSNTSLLDVR